MKEVRQEHLHQAIEGDFYFAFLPTTCSRPTSICQCHKGTLSRVDSPTVAALYISVSHEADTPGTKQHEVIHVN